MKRLSPITFLKFIESELPDDKSAIELAEILAQTVGRIVKVYRRGGKPLTVAKPHPYLH